MTKKINKILTIPEVKIKLNDLFTQYDIINFITADTIEKWIKNKSISDESKHIHNCLILGLLYGLNANQLMKASNKIIDLYNELDNLIFPVLKNPSEEQGGFNIFKIRENWPDHFDQAIIAFKKDNCDKALIEVNDGFHEILKERTVDREIYRQFLNKAMIQLRLGDKFFGNKFLEIALDLNPNYDLAITNLQQYQDGYFDELIGSSGKYEDNTLRLETDPAYRYYKFLKQYEIDFTTKQLTKTDIVPLVVKFTEKGLGRNDLCFCGSGKKYKKCCLNL